MTLYQALRVTIAATLLRWASAWLPAIDETKDADHYIGQACRCLREIDFD